VSSDDEGDGRGNDAETAALRDIIRGGAFDALVNGSQNDKENSDDDEEEVEEIEIEPSDDDDDDDVDANVDDKKEEVEDDKKEEDEDDKMEEDEKEVADGDAEGSNDRDEKDSDDDEEDEDQEERGVERERRHVALSTALRAVDRHLPFAETLAVIAPTPLPFSNSKKGSKKRKRDKFILEEGEGEDFDDEEDDDVDVHDDLKREVAFHDMALESVVLARDSCERSSIPFVRPDDYFAEMVKTDEHMSRIKDRLIFENKKMEAVERRRSDKEGALSAKERKSNKLEGKAASKRAHMEGVEEWKKSAERGRGKLGGKVEDGADELRLKRMESGGQGNKRMAADRKFGFGGKRGRFKGNDTQTLNDASGFNPKGGFGGVGSKSTGGKGKGNKRAGKRARDSKRS